MIYPIQPAVPASSRSYAIVSPVRDEQRYVELTLRSVTSQTEKPAAWVLVDDGSTDRTAEIIGGYAAEHPFIRVVGSPRAGARKTGSPVIRAFNVGYQTLGGSAYDYVVKLDCDLSFAPDYFQKLLDRISGEEKIGIASGVYCEADGAGAWKVVDMPSYHAAGACKVLRRQCFEEIGGFVTSAGWDTVDEIKAMARGWRTTHFGDLQVRHHKPEGSGIGLVRTSLMHGEIHYLTGGSRLFFLLKCIHRLRVKPYVLNALVMAWGYHRAMIKRKPRLVTEQEARCYRALLRGRISSRVKSLIG